jgi:hypothetical protein
VVPLTGGEMLVQRTGMTEEVIDDPIVIEQLSQDECHNLALASDEFDVNILDNEHCNEENIDEYDEASSSDNEEESNEALVGTGGEGNDSLVPQNVDEDDEAASTDNEEESNEALVDIGGEGNDSFVPQFVVHVSRIDLMLYYTYEELRTLKLKHINLHESPNHKDINDIGTAVCNSALVSEEGNPRITDEAIKKGQLFESLDVVEFFL